MPTTIDFSQGFGQAQGELQFNGSASLAGTALELTNGGLNEASSAFYPSPVNVQSFTTDFTFQLTNPNADGFTFTIQNVGPGALGADGGSLGYAGIGQSVAVKFDLFQNHGDPSNNSTGIFIDGALPIGPTSIDLTGSGINLHSGDKMDAHLTYDGTTLNLTLTDTVTWKTWSHPFAINIPATVGGDTAYVGFTGATGAETSIQQILTWSYQAGQPLYYPKGFSSGSSLAMNGSASLSGTSLQLTTRESKRGRQRLLYDTSEYPVLHHRFRLQANGPRRRRLHLHDSECRPHRARRPSAVRWDMRASARVLRSSSTSSKMPGTPRITPPAFLSTGLCPLGRPQST